MNQSTEESEFVYTSSAHTNRIKFGVLFVLQFFSFGCYIFIAYHFYRKPQLHRSHHHHVIILLLSVSFLFLITALPLTEAYLFNSYAYPSTQTFCSVWIWLHYSLNIINLFLMAFASIERHWLIFYPSLVRNKIGLLIFHYCPLVFCLIYPPVFYFTAIFIYRCDFFYDHTKLLCKWPCYFYNRIWTNIDLFVNNYMPLFSIPIFCTIIYIRVFIQKRTMKQKAFKWHRDKKMILQLWTVSSLYLALWMPLQLLGLINAYWSPSFLLQAQIDYLFLLPYFIHLLYPFIVLINYRHTILTVGPNNTTVQGVTH